MVHDTWPLVQAYVRANPKPVSHVARQSYANFLRQGIARVLVEAPTIKWKKSKVCVGGPEGDRVKLSRCADLPSSCRLLDKTYLVTVLADVTDATGDEVVAKDVRLCDIPLMVGCEPCATYSAAPEALRHMRECPNDSGGYFIIEGKEKVLASVLETSVSAITYRTGKVDKKSSHIVSAFNKACMVSSPVAPDRISQLRFRVIGGNGHVAHVPIVSAIRALGTVSDRDVAAAITATSCGRLSVDRAQEAIRASLVAVASDGPLQMTALASIATATASTGTKGALRSVRECVPGARNDAERAMSIAYIASQCILHIQNRPSSIVDRDSYEAKGVATAGVQFCRAFEKRWIEHATQASADLSSRAFSDTSLPAGALKHSLFDSEMESVLVKMFRSSGEAGSVFDVPRYTLQGASAYVSHIINPVSASEIDTRGPHAIHPTQFGFVCPVQTPEGKQIGLTTSFACMARVSGSCSVVCDQEGALFHRLHCAGMKADPGPIGDARETSMPATILLNGVAVGFADRPAKFVRRLRQDRQSGKLHSDVGVAWSLGGAVRMHTSGGRLMRPLLIYGEIGQISGRRAPMCWSDCIAPSDSSSSSRVPCVEYLDVSECAHAMIAPFAFEHEKEDTEDDQPAFTHVEIHPTAFLSFVANMTPFSDRNAAVRNVFSCKQMKSCAAVHSTAFRSRLDTSTHILHAGQQPIVDTAWSGIGGSRSLPFGVNAMVAISSFSGYNQEDAIIVNSASVQRGLFASTHLHTIVVDENVADGGVFCNPGGRAVEMKADSYADLEPSGLPRVGSCVRPGKAIVGHVTKGEADTSLVCDLTVNGRVHHAAMFEKGGSVGRRAKVCLYSVRDVAVGDKFSNRHGQKGICARLVEPENMIYLLDGSVPDIVINPHALPTRMTLGQILEGLCAKAACYTGSPFVDATVSCAPSMSRATEELAPHAEMLGEEMCLDPRTGQMQQCPVCWTPNFYMRLTHMVADKIGCSRAGKTRRDLRTGQPVRGRAEGGALRIGEMETNTILAHGAAMFLRDAFTSNSDGPTVTGTVLSSGSVCVPDAQSNTIPVRDCGWVRENTVVPDVRVPRSFSLFQAEVAGSLNISMDALPEEST